MTISDVVLTIKPKFVSFSHIWKTATLKTIKGKVVRSALRTWPYFSFQGKFFNQTPSQINYLKRNVLKYGASIWAIPSWWDLTTLEVEASSGQTSLQVKETSYRQFHEERDVIIINPTDWRLYEVCTISGDSGSISEDEIILKDNLVSSWAIGSYVLPLYDYHIDPVSFSQVFSNVESFTIKAEEAYEEERAFEYTLPVSGEQTYEGLDIFSFSPSFPLKYSYEYPFLRMKFYGMEYAQTDYDISNLDIGLSFYKSSKKDIHDLLNFFDSKQGMFQKFWLSTWSKDVVINAPFDAADDIVSIDDIEYSSFYMDEDVIGRHLFFRFPDGSVTQKKIIDVSSGGEEITLSEAIGTSVSTEELADMSVSFLMLVCFSIDEVKVNYVEGLYSSQIDFNFRLLLEETEVD